VVSDAERSETAMLGTVYVLDFCAGASAGGHEKAALWAACGVRGLSVSFTYVQLNCFHKPTCQDLKIKNAAS